MAILVGFYTAIVCGLLYIAYTHKFFHLYTAFKAVAGLGFMAIAVLLSTGDFYSILLLCAMTACLIGDVFLGLANNLHKYFGKLFICGLSVFAFAHVLFVLGFSSFAKYNFFDLFMGVLGFAVTLFISKQKSFLFSKMKIPALIYSVFVGLMCASGINAFIALGTKSSAFIAAGSILFLVSDFLILFLYFKVKKPRKIIRVLNLLTYYLAMLCLAFSL